MENKMTVEFENQNYRSSRIGSLVVLETKTDGFQSLVKIEDNMELFNRLDFINQDKSIKGILIIGKENNFGDEAFAKHLATMTGEMVDPKNPTVVKKIVDSSKRTIQINILNGYIRKFIEMPKMLFVALSGCIVSPFWGMSLAADFKIGSIDFSVHLNSKEYGLHPSGGVPFFMIKHIGLSKTQEMLYGEKYINAETLKSLGFINRVISADNFRDDAISVAFDILESTCCEYFYYTKQLININLLKDFDNYTSLESKMTLH